MDLNTVIGSMYNLCNSCTRFKDQVAYTIDQAQPNRKQTPTTKLRFCFLCLPSVCFGSAKADPGLNPSRPQADP